MKREEFFIEKFNFEFKFKFNIWIKSEQNENFFLNEQKYEILI